jgi:DNA polymerase-3 subunit delta'
VTAAVAGDNHGACSRPLPWHDGVWEQARSALDRGRLAHALLLSGPDGTGRRHFALALARLLLCEAPTGDGNCGTCKSCELTRHGAHADMLSVAPEEPGKAIGVDAVRAVLAFTGRTSSLGLRKVIIVAPLQALTSSAHNAFLKCLEEPPADTYFVLVHGRGRRIPATVRSRCQTLDLRAPDEAQARQWLQATLEVDASKLEGLGALAPRQPLRAVQLAQDEEQATLLQQLRLGLSSGDLAAAQQAATQLDAPELLAHAREHLVELARRQGRGEHREALRRTLLALDRVEELRAAVEAGSNPNADLLRFSVLQACGATGGAI